MTPTTHDVYALTMGVDVIATLFTWQPWRRSTLVCFLSVLAVSENSLANFDEMDQTSSIIRVGRTAGLYVWC